MFRSVESNSLPTLILPEHPDDRTPPRLHYEYRGDQMAPTVQRGNWITATLDGYDGSEGLFVILDGGLVRIQRCPERGFVWVLSDNKKYGDYKVPRAWTRTNVIGKVIGVTKVLDHTLTPIRRSGRS